MQFRKCTLVELLNRVLDRGLFLDADLVIYVAEVPLVSARIMAAISSVETMVAQGLTDERALMSVRSLCSPSRPAGEQP